MARQPAQTARTTAAAAPASGGGRSVPNTASGVAPGDTYVIPDEEDEDDTSGTFSAIGDVGFATGDTSDAQAVANGVKLGQSVRGAPIGMPKTVRIILEESAGPEIPPTGLPVSLNGKAYLIRPGEEVDIPVGVREILDNAIMHIAVQDPQSMKVIGHRKRLRFPYRLVA